LKDDARQAPELTKSNISEARLDNERTLQRLRRRTRVHVSRLVVWLAPSCSPIAFL